MAVERTTVWLDEKQLKNMELLVKQEDMKNNSECVNKALEFYSGYMFSKNSSKFISEILVGEMEGIVKSSEKRLQRQLNHNTLELNMLLNVMAACCDFEKETVQELRDNTLEDMKNTNKKMSFEKAYNLQKGE